MTLIRRYASVIASDKGFMGLMLALPAVLGVVSTVIPADFGLAPPTPRRPSTAPPERSCSSSWSACASPAPPTRSAS
ncbi:hypothetical protein ACFQVA_07195 [Actinomadura keratinilytica]